MQAIILAAGMGRRLGDLTANNTKCMIEVNGQKLIDRMLTQLSRLSLNRVVIVVGYQADNLKKHIGNRYDGKLNIEYVENPIYDKTNNIYSLALAKEHLQQDDTLLLESDLIFDDKLLDIILSNSYPNLALVAKYETWMDGTMMQIDDQGNILNFIPKKAFRYEDVALYHKTVNIYKFSRKFSEEQYVPFLDAYSRVMGNNEYYEQVLRVIKALPIGDERWYEIDDIQDRDIAETIFASKEERLAKYHHRFGGYWRFPHLLDFCYLVNPYFPTPRMKDDTLLTEYPSGMGVNSLLAGKYFGIKQDYVCVGNGAAELIKALIEGHVEGKIGVTTPTFEEYPNRVEESRVVRFVPQNKDFAYTAQDLMDFFADKGIGRLLVVNPDNPSGNFIPVGDIFLLADWCKQRGVRLIVDESFVDFTYNYASNSLLHNDLLEKYDNLVVMKSISKSYGVPGLRLGVLASSNTELIARLKKEVAIWNINSFGEFYMQIFSKYEKNYAEACQLFIDERERFGKELQKVPFLRVIPSQANYFLCEVTDRFTSHELTSRMLDFNILIKDCSTKSGFDGRSYVRLAVRDQKDNDRLVSALLSL